MKTLSERICSIKNLTSALIGTSLVLTACQGGFNSEMASDLRPPVTSDPKTSLDQRRLDSQQKDRGLPPDSILDSEAERESFYSDLTEQKPVYNDDELAKEAEEQYQKQLEKQSEKHIEEPKPKKESAATGPYDFCRELNVAKGKGEMDLSDLYNQDSKLAAAMPTEALSALKTRDMKNKFVCILLPAAIRMQEQVYRQRLEVLRLQSKQAKGELTAQDKTWLTEMKVAYNLKGAASMAELLARVDVVPLPLLLAQAALESGWGRSKATKDLNNLFGLHAAKGQPCKTGYDTRNACVRIFKSIGESISAYIRLLNVVRPYEEFRVLRAKMRAEKKPLDSDQLLLTLKKYNESPAQYVRDVREIMHKSNKFGQFVFKEEEVQGGAP